MTSKRSSSPVAPPDGDYLTYRLEEARKAARLASDITEEAERVFLGLPDSVQRACLTEYARSLDVRIAKLAIDIDLMKAERAVEKAEGKRVVTVDLVGDGGEVLASESKPRRKLGDEFDFSDLAGQFEREGR